MKKMVSVYAFSPNMLVDGVRAGIEQGCRYIRPVMSKGQVIAPTAVFEKGLGAEI